VTAKPRKFNGLPRSLKTAKEPEKYRLEPYFVKENFSYTLGAKIRRISVFLLLSFLAGGH